jgi:hypothetical protein
VTDYKKKGTPTQAQIFGERPVSSRCPSTRRCCRRRPAGAQRRYYSLEEARYIWVTGGRRPMADGPAMETALGRLELAVAEMASRLRAGDFTAPRTCASCGQRGVCRARFLGEAHGRPLR